MNIKQWTGDVDAMVMMAKHFFSETSETSETGYGQEESQEKGVEWLHKAANSGSSCPQAAYEIACRMILKAKEENPRVLLHYFDKEVGSR